MRPRGFTLIEMLVALAILAIALAAVQRGVSIALSNAFELKQRLLAQWVAENRLAELRASHAFPEPGELAGEERQAGIRFVWRATVSHTPNPHFRRVELRVRADESAPALATLVGYLSGGGHAR